jgi:hypothetical protein
LWDLLDKAYPVLKGNIKQESALYPIVSEIGKKAAALEFEPIANIIDTKKDSVQ